MNLRKYWEERISKFGLLGAGDISLHPKVNEIVKKLRAEDIRSMVKFSGKRVLDAGCGTGLYSRLAKELGAKEVIALDFALPAVKMSKSRDIEGILASVSHLPFSDECFDVVMCISVLYHIIDDEMWELAISELSRVLKRGGILLLQIENRDNYFISKTYRGRPLGLYMKKFRENNLKILRIEDVYAPPKNKILRLILRYIPSLSKLMIKKRKENILITLEKMR